jgi:hypothetical protein
VWFGGERASLVWAIEHTKRDVQVWHIADKANMRHDMGGGLGWRSMEGSGLFYLFIYFVSRDVRDNR